MPSSFTNPHMYLCIQLSERRTSKGDKLSAFVSLSDHKTRTRLCGEFLITDLEKALAVMKDTPKEIPKVFTAEV